MAELPADVQAALDAYLAARVDDATWEAYVNGLSLGVALDLATDLCLWTLQDARAAQWIARDFVSDPDDWDDPAVPEPPRGLRPFRTLQDFLDAEPSMGSYTICLQRESHTPLSGWDVTYTVRLDFPTWEAEGCYRADESLARRDVVWARVGSDEERAPFDPWAVAACRAACLAWSPEWARAQVQAEADS